MKVQAELGINADAEVVVHDEDLGGVLVGVGGVGVIGDGHLCLVLLFLIRVKDHCPPVSHSCVGVSFAVIHDCVILFTETYEWI